MPINQIKSFSFSAVLRVCPFWCQIKDFSIPASEVWSLDVKEILTSSWTGFSYTAEGLALSFRAHIWFTYPCLQTLILDRILNMLWIFFSPVSWEVEACAILMQRQSPKRFPKKGSTNQPMGSWIIIFILSCFTLTKVSGVELPLSMAEWTLRCL